MPTDEIVPGDILELEAGNIVPADAIVRQTRELLVDETTSAGESVPVSSKPVTSWRKNSAHLPLCPPDGMMAGTYSNGLAGVR